VKLNHFHHDKHDGVTLRDGEVHCATVELVTIVRILSWLCIP